MSDEIGNGINVINPEGEIVSLPADQVAEATSPENGYRLPEPGQVEQHFKEQEYGTLPQQALTAVEGIGEGVAGPLFTGAERAVAETTGFTSPEAMLARRETNPGVHAIAQGAGLVGSTLLAPEYSAAKWLTRAGEGAAGLAGLGHAAEGMSVAARIGAHGVRTATEMAILQAGDETSKMLMSDPNTSLQSAIADVGLAAVLGGAGGAVLGAVPPLWNATVGKKLSGMLESARVDAQGNVISDGSLRPVFRKMLSTYGGVAEQDIDSYLANHKAISELPEFDEIYNRAMDHIGKISDNLEASKIGVGEAHSQYKELERSMKDELRSRTFDASVADTFAKQAMKDAQGKLAFDLQERALNAGQLVNSAAEQLRQQVVDGSRGAYEVLEKELTTPISLKPFYEKGQELLGQLEGQGTLESKQMAARLNEYLEGISEKTLKLGAIDGVQAKQFIQGLDQVSKYDFSASSFDKGLSKYYKQLRHTLDDTLKTTIKPYAEAMKPIAAESSLLRDLDRYGTEEEAVAAIKQLKNPVRLKNEMPLLEQLEKKTGIKFLDEIKPYANPEHRANLMKALPEFNEAQKTASAVRALKNPKTLELLADDLSQSAEKRALMEAESTMQAAKAEKGKLQGLSPASLEGKLKTVKFGRGIEAAKILSQIPGFNGKTIPELLDLIRVKESFEKNATRGSKHVNMFGGILGGGMGLVTGGIHGAGAGAAMGAGLGAAVDNFGPQMVKGLLDRYLTKFGDIEGLSGGDRSSGLHALFHKVLSSQGPIDAEAFKSGVDYARAVDRGQSIMSKAVKNILKPGGEVLATKLIPTDKDRKRLIKEFDDIRDNPKKVFDNNSKFVHYLDGHSSAQGALTRAAFDYFESITPKSKKTMMMDKEIEPTAEAKAEYNKALDLAQQPALIFSKVKDGTVTSRDISLIKTVMPAFYKDSVMKLSDAIIEHMAEGETIPYKTRIGLAKFLGEPLDSTMISSNIASIQQSMSGLPMNPTDSMAVPRPDIKNPNALKKQASMLRTPTQSGELQNTQNS